ncbi:MAG: guanylate kinase [Chloroflexi bacterium]|nr:MAG: guanylate kinase [Chloroflexota bacterium]
MTWEVSDYSLEPKLRTKRRDTQSSRSLLIVLSGPSGVGKDAVLARMRELGRPFHYVVTATTRPKRAREKDGIDYHFLSRKEFQQMVNDNQFLEWANVYGNYYGVPKDEITSALSKGVDAVVKVDVQGAATIKKILPHAVFIFLAPSSTEELEKRLKKRQSESSADLALRLEKAREEIKSLPLFDYVITCRQNKLDEVVSRIDAIVAAEKCRVKPKIVEL